MEKPLFREALKFWFRLGWISFGGTAAHIAIMHDFLVDKKKWISNSKFLHALSLCMILPGPEAQQLSIFIGSQLHGKKGGLAAGILFVLPSMFILLALSIIYVLFGNLPWISAMFNGLKPAVIALIIIALIRLGQKALRGVLHIIVASAAFVCMYFFAVSLLALMAGAVILAIVIRWTRPSLFHNKATVEEAAEEQGYYINKYSVACGDGLKLGRILKLTAVFVAIWFVPFTLFSLFASDLPFWKGLSLFFTKTAFVTIGGSYTVIPYVAQITVTKFHWLSKLQMMDGFALAETTPGPLIIVLAFVGFMAGYNQFNGSLLMGTVGLLAATFYTFLPCFLFVFVGAPGVGKTENNPLIQGMLGLITAVVVGAISDLTIFLGKNVIFLQGIAAVRNIQIVPLLWVVISLILLKRFRLNVIALIGLSILFGLVQYLIGNLK
ncbi:MAG TPA: chromate efflux transporter [Puia sp.]|nr:chromate efflux transporter [Puia sp.]